MYYTTYTVSYNTLCHGSRNVLNLCILLTYRLYNKVENELKIKSMMIESSFSLSTLKSLYKRSSWSLSIIACSHAAHCVWARNPGMTYFVRPRGVSTARRASTSLKKQELRLLIWLADVTMHKFRTCLFSGKANLLQHSNTQGNFLTHWQC